MNSSLKVWVIDDDKSIRWVLEKTFKQAGMEVRTFEDGSIILAELELKKPDVIVTDVRMPGVDGLTLLGKINQTFPNLPVIVITAHSDLDAAVSAYESGAFEYLPKPFDVDEAVNLVQRAWEHAKQSKVIAEEINIDKVETKEIIGEAPSMQEVFRIIGRLSKSHINVLINGESGTGKELVAHALHRHSPRADKPFIALNMAAIPKDLMESELFGHEKGSFTGAHTSRKGRFEQADSGTLFLDEIGDMPTELQTRLLRVLEDGEYFRVGAHVSTKVDVRVVAATHQNIEELVEQGKFREDLFHRLNVIRIHLPRLSERREDIPKLARFFIDKISKELGVEAKILSEEVIHYMTNYPWPGNVRQLENTCRWLSVMASGQEILMGDLPPELRQISNEETGETTWEKALEKWLEQRLLAGQTEILGELMPAFEKIIIETTLRFNGGKKRDASELLGWGRNTLTRKIKELGLE
ncbi:MAG: nitrogen regulation protein NR(I) [Gammaproteobacteria bacterium]|nr:MAG: nitrogen regulation protein NR(I) [Gammaproteobacteria bacterium]